MDVELRLDRIGQDDNGTGANNHLLLTVGLPGYKAFGTTIRISADRCEVDGQARILRTDNQWHRWRFEIDSRHRTVDILRDNQPIALQPAGSRQNGGIRLTTRGDTQVAVRNLTVVPLPGSTTRTALKPLAPQTEVAKGEWPQWRRDTRNTAQSDLVGAIQSPEIAWKYPVGNIAPTPLFHDLDGDGTREVLVAHGGRLSAHSARGSQLWNIPALAASVWGVHDLAGDGKPALVISAGNPSRLQILNPATGHLRYDCPQFPKAGVAGVRIAKLDPNRRGLQAVVWSAQHEVGFTLGFQRGIENAEILWTFDWKTANFTPTVCLADMDRDRNLDLVVTTYDRTFVFDGRSGRQRIDFTWPSGRNYGATVVRDVDHDGYPDVVVLADFLREHIAVLKNERGRSLRLLWDRFVEQDYPEDKRSLSLLTEAVDDFDDDGEIEIAASIWDGSWSTEIIETRTGKTKVSLPRTLVTGAGPLFPGAPPVLLVLNNPDRNPQPNVTTDIVSLQNGKVRTLGTLPSGSPLNQSLQPEFPDHIGSTHKVLTQVLRPRPDGRPGVGLVIASTTPPRVQFLAGRNDGTLETVWTAAPPSEWKPPTIASIERPRRTALLMQHERAGRALDLVALAPGTPGLLLSTDRHGVIRLSEPSGTLHGLIRTETGMVTNPVVARIGNDPTPKILFFDATGQLQCLKTRPAAQPERQWSEPGIGSIPRMVPYIDTFGSPVVARIGTETSPSIVIARPPHSLVALDSEGNEKRRWDFPSLPQQWILGNLDTRPGNDLVVTYPTGAFLQVDTTARSGNTGGSLWTRPIGNGPLGIADLNGDGADDIILRDLFERRVLDGPTGRDMLPTSQWAGYHVPAIVTIDPKRGLPGIAWLGGMYSVLTENPVGKQPWWHPANSSLRDFGTGPGAVADVDGDSRLEIGLITSGQLYNWPKFYRVDGPDKDFLCYDAATGRLKWKHPVGATTAGVVAADVDGDGKLDFVFGTEDGRLMALSGAANPSRRVLWSMQFPAALGQPIPADIDGTGKMALLVSCADGNLYAVTGKPTNMTRTDTENR